MSIIEKAVNKTEHAELIANTADLSTEPSLFGQGEASINEGNASSMEQVLDNPIYEEADAEGLYAGADLFDQDNAPINKGQANTIESLVKKADQAGQLNHNARLPMEAGLYNGKAPSLGGPFSTDNEKVYKKKDDYSAPQDRVEIDWARLAELGFVTPSDVNTKTIEEYRNIKRPLVYNAFGAGSVGIARSNLILVTSSVPGEGKTFTAINLALSIANERDKKVLLIDADVARPSVSKTLGIYSPSRPGLIDYLEGENIDYSDIELSTNMQGLRIIPAGKLHKYSTELLSSNKMALFAEELSNRYPDRIVIFDSPPLLAATQGEVLAKLVGQVVLVVEAEKTLQSMVMESVSKLSVCDVVLLVFNKTLISLSDGYYYGYGYGQYATH
ncbi:MAG: XrtA-associated tyrosine autokinase [Methylovulum miyakonense]|uniref:XrtA-associated tyrosine autokinase n=1 Tax=Methylovulum miyakonense TaxID=645578 RepID=UPI003BB606B6